MAQPACVVLGRHSPFPIGTEKAGSCHSFLSRRHLLGCRWRGGCSLACSGVQTQSSRVSEGPIGATSTHGFRVVGGAWCACSRRARLPSQAFFIRSHPCSHSSSTFVVRVALSQGFNSLSATLSTHLEFVSAPSLDLVNSLLAALLAPPLDLRLASPLEVVVPFLIFRVAATRPRRSGAMPLVTAPCVAA
jgi:hypothetical protein